MSNHLSGRLDLTPADLDRLEDALEDLEFSSLDELAADDDPVAQRLSEYRELLVLGRQALPLEDVPAGLLDGVLAEARQAAAAKPVAVDAGASPSFWARWRLGTWVPALAFAGSAALLLVVLVPERSSEPDVATVAQSDSAAKQEAKADAKMADGRLAYAEAESEEREKDDALLEGEAQRAGGVVIGERAPEPAAAPPPAEELADADEPEPELAAKSPARRKAAETGIPGASAGGKPMPKAPTSSGSGGSSKGKTNALPDPLGGADTGTKKDAPKAEQKPDDGSWSEIERADADRRGGSCGLAKMRYDKLRKVDDARVRARALAGAGLCAAASDDMSTAKKLFAQARAADPGVSGFIDRELAAIESEPANADAPDNAADPAPAD